MQKTPTKVATDLQKLMQFGLVVPLLLKLKVLALNMIALKAIFCEQLFFSSRIIIF